ncbi:MAG: alpha/beta hydrolase [Clostridiaceae bacterium]
MNCKIKRLSINYEIIGEGKPIIMLHGYSVDHRLMIGCMEPVFEKEDKYKRIYIDLPGMGKSESADWITNSDIMLDIVIDFINKVIPGENFLLAGESYGGYLARGVVYKMMERVEGLLLICPAIIADRKRRNVPEHVVLVKDENLLSKLTIEEAEDFNPIAVVQSEKIYKRYKEEILSGISSSNEEFLDELQQNGYGFSFNVDKLYKKFDKPSLILLGKQDSCVGYKDAWNIIDNYSRASFAILDRAGHNLQLEQPDLFNALVKEWLVRVQRF